MLSKEDLQQIASLIQQGRRETQDGSHLNDKTHTEELLNKLFGGSQTAYPRSLAEQTFDDTERKQRQKSFYDTMYKGYKNAGLSDSDAKARAATDTAAYGRNLKAEQQKLNDELLNFTTAIAEARKKIEEGKDKEASDNVYRTLSNGRSDRVRNQGNAISTFGESLKRVGGKSGMGKFGSILTRAGGGIAKFGVSITKAAGPIGIVIEKLIEFAKLIGDINRQSKEIEAAKINKETNIVRGKGAIQMTKIQGLSQIAQNNMAAASAAQGAAASAASTAQSAAGAFAQEAVGINSEMAVQGKKIEYDTYATAHEIASELPFAIKESAYKAAEAAIDFGGQAANFKANSKYAGQSIDIARQKMNNQIGTAYAAANAQIGGAYGAAAVKNAGVHENTGRTIDLQEQRISNQAYEADYNIGASERKLTATTIGGSMNLLTGILGYVPNKFNSYLENNYRKPQFDVNNSRMQLSYAQNETLTTSINALTDSITSLEAQNIQNAASARATSIQLAGQARDMQLSIKKQQIDMKKQIENAAVESATKIAKAWLKMTEKLNDTFLKHQAATEKMGREMGLNGEKLDRYNEQMAAYQVGVAKWGKDMEWMQKAQGGYQQNSGRNVEWSQRDFETTASLGLVAGEESISEYVNGMEIFNHSVSDSNEKLYTMFKEVSNIGLNGVKYAKDLAKNLKLAEKFNFKGGVESLMRMSKWAQNMRFNVDSLDGMLDKVQTGGIEGVIKQSAELQVLGGNFAMGSDPLAMAYESYMNPDAYAKRMNKMISGQGVLDSSTGEVSFGIASQQMMRQFAESTGQDYKDVLNQARAQVKIGEIEGSLNGDFTEEQKMAIANKAQYDQKDGKWKVKVGNENVAVDELNQQQVEAITPSENVEQDMLMELRSIRSIQEQYTGMQGENMSLLENGVWPELKGTNERIINSVGEDFRTNYEKYQTEALNNLALLESAQKEFISMFQEGNKEVDEKVGEILTAANNINKTMGEIKTKTEEFINGAMKQTVPTFGVAGFGAAADDLKAMKEALLAKYKEQWAKVEGKEKENIENGVKKYDTIGASDDKIKSNKALLAAAEKDKAIMIHGKKYTEGTKEYTHWKARLETENVALENNKKSITNATDGTYTGPIYSPGQAFGANVSAQSLKKIQQEKEESYQRSKNGGSSTTTKKSGGGTKTTSSSNKSQGNITPSNNTTKNVNNLIDTLNKGATDWYVNMNVQSGNAFSNLSEKGAASLLSMAKAGEVKLVDMSTAGGQSLTDMSKLSTTELQKMAQNGTLYLGDMSTSGSQKLTAMAATGELGLTQAANNTNIGFGVATKTAKEGATEIKTSGADIKKGAGDIKTGADGMKTASDNLSNSAKESNSIWHRMVTYFFGDEKTKEKGLLQKLTDKLPSWLSGKSDDGIIGVSGALNKINDGTVIQNGKITRINDKDQVLAAKNGGPVDRMLDMVHTLSSQRSVTYQPTVSNPIYHSFVQPIKTVEQAKQKMAFDRELEISEMNNMIRMATDMLSNVTPIVEPMPMSYTSTVTESPYKSESSKNDTNGKIEIAPIQISINGNIQLNGTNGMIDITQQIANDPNFIRSLTQMISMEVERKINGGKVTNVLNRNLQY